MLLSSQNRTSFGFEKFPICIYPLSSADSIFYMLCSTIVQFSTYTYSKPVEVPCSLRR